MQNNEDCASLVKVFTKKKLDIKAYNCLICVQRTGKEGLRKLQEKEIATFIKSLKMQNLSLRVRFIVWSSRTRSIVVWIKSNKIQSLSFV